MSRKKYSCGECNAILKKGDSFCNRCGAKLEWPEEKSTPKKQGKFELSDSAIRKLTNSSVGLSVGVLLCCGLGAIIAPILFVQQSDMKKWLYASGNNKPFSDEIVIDKAVSIKNACIWAIMLSILEVVLNILFYIAISTINSASFTGLDAFLWFIYVVRVIIGIICASTLYSEAEKIVDY